MITFPFVFLFIILSSILSIFVVCKNGVDLSVATSEKDWLCLLSQFNVSFALIRVYRSIGKIDIEAANSITYAHLNEIRDIDVYMFPCVSSSSYSINNNITCPSPQIQVIQILEYLKTNHISIRYNDDSDISNKKAYINRIWLDIEDEVPSKYYNSNIQINQEIISSVVDTLEAFRIPIGIYTTTTYWNNIMGGINDYSKYPLWYPRYDGVNNMEFFVPFSGWDKVTTKQTNGSTYFCGITQVDSDYMEDF